jgi:outer membrane protein TolC
VISAQTAELSNRKLALVIQGRHLTASVQLIKALGGGWHKNTESTEQKVLTTQTKKQIRN